MTFFQGTIKQARPLLPDCRSCGALSQCRFGKQRSEAKKANRVLVVDKPGADSANGLWTGYDHIRRAFSRAGIDFSAYTIVPAAACPKPTDGALKHCQPLMISEIKRLDPEVILTWGSRATASVVEWLWDHPAEMPDRWYGRQIPSRKINAWVCPVGYKGQAGGYNKNREVSEIWLYRHLKAAHALRARPYTTVPKYDARKLYSRREAMELIEAASASELSAFDYESTGIKGDADCHSITSVGIAYLDKDTPVGGAFLLTPDLEQPVRDYLQSDSYKVGANSKFEERWSRTKLGVRVRRWFWDTMLAAHWEDPHEGTTGVKFQAFARLGLPGYADEVEAFFKHGGTKEPNLIHRIPVNALLEYNAIDAYAELDLAILQMRENGITDRWHSVNLPLR